MRNRYLVLKSARHRIEQIHRYSVELWGFKQAETYVSGLFECFEQIVDRQVLWRTIPAEFEVSGYFTKYEKHFIFWKELSDGRVGIAAILHAKMNLAERLKEEF